MQEILKTIYEMNALGKKPTRTDLCRKLTISQPTMRKRMAELITAGYIREARYGRSVVVEITDLGRNAFRR
jgi:Mn-dependent DtxR family transcriptional regulator